MADYEHNLRPELLKAKLDYINLRWGVNKDLLNELIASDPLLDISRNARKKFKRYLSSLETAFASLAQRYLLEDRSAQDGFLTEYHAQIRRELGNETRFLQYLTGEWDDEILRVVSIAQKQHMIPEKVKTITQQKPRVSFQPRSQYRDYLNR